MSTACLLLGVAAAHATHNNVVIAGVAGLVAGAMSMAAGEYVSVHSQADTEEADLKLERTELKLDLSGERKELTAIYVDRGVNPQLAGQVADQLMAHDAIDTLAARQIQAAFASAGSFAEGAAMPVSTAAIASEASLIPLVFGTSMVFLALLGVWPRASVVRQLG